MENYKVDTALYIGDTVYTIGETVKLTSKENKTITGKIVDINIDCIYLSCDNIFEPDAGFTYYLNVIKSIEKVNEKE